MRPKVSRTERKDSPTHEQCFPTNQRCRVPGAIVRLGVPGEIAGFEIDTRHFTGNYPPEGSIEGCRSDDKVPGEDAEWTTLVPRTALNGNDRRLAACEAAGIFTHVRLSIFPDGGVARFRIHGI